jgi:hypothetical protein
MFYSALSLWLGLKFFARYDPQDGSTPMTPQEFNVWYGPLVSPLSLPPSPQSGTPTHSVWAVSAGRSRWG